ncbi:MAG: ABC-three component system middle component 5 [Gluconobacter sp.]|uniref:ABC-three component system middle component 5 n=1 Tax=Gluconobacter sp. TaxID=1876758 RepID=UPI0039E7D3C9
MIQLTYEPAFDPLHSIFRALRLRQGLRTGLPLPRVLFRILDFYLLFPESLKNIRLRPEHRSLKNQAAATKRAASYGPRPEDAILFERMQPYQDAAVNTLALQGFFSNDELEADWVVPSEANAPAALTDRLLAVNAAEESLLAALNTLASDYPLDGVNGIKHRTGLLEYRYDAV